MSLDYSRAGELLLTRVAVVSSHPFVAECCVVGLPDELKGEVKKEPLSG